MSIERLALATFLDKVAPGYPLGIPSSAIAQPEVESLLACTFVLITTTTSLADEYAELLEAIATKGLKLARGVWQVKVALPSDSSPMDLSTPLTVVLGGAQHPGAIQTGAHGKVLFSHSIIEIAKNPSIKREFWGHLQSFLAT